jgi:hypothetical protein
MIITRSALVVGVGLLFSSTTFANVAPPPVTKAAILQDVATAFVEGGLNHASLETLDAVISGSHGFSWAENGKEVAASKEQALAMFRAMLTSHAGLRIEGLGTWRVLETSDTSGEVIIPFTMYGQDKNGKEHELLKGIMTLSIMRPAGSEGEIIAGHISTVSPQQ